jgi:hypothetical protein
MQIDANTDCTDYGVVVHSALRSSPQDLERGLSNQFSSRYAQSGFLSLQLLVQQYVYARGGVPKQVGG